MQQIVDKYAGRPTPRYTSYPTAPHFRQDFPEETYRLWLSQLDTADPISLYLHVPFCRKMCWYCGCNMKLASRREPVAEYVADLHREIDNLADALPTSMPVAHLHWGGGTPTVLEPDDLEALTEHLQARFSFIPDAELAIESDPRTLSDTMVERIGALGYSRASFGVQEFDPDVQQAINRIQPPEMVANATDRLRSAGVTNINFDLIYGLPNQTSDSLARTVDVCAELRPNRIALFGYAHVPWMAKNQRMIDTDALPGNDERTRQASTAAQALKQHGYKAIGIDHFALPEDDLAVAAKSGRLRRNFQGYTSDTAQTLLGLGATSIGRTPSGYIQNIAETGAWARAVRSGRLPVARGHETSTDDALRAHVIERIMCDGEIDLRDAGNRHDRPHDWYAAEIPSLRELQQDDIIVQDNDYLALTETGAPLARIVAAVFDTYLAKSQAKHSRSL